MIQEESFGILPLKKEEEKWSLFLIQHRNGHHWGPSKGHANLGETPIETAQRELKEETGLEIVSKLDVGPFYEHYNCIKEGELVLKKVTYFVATVSGAIALQKEEIEDGNWFPIHEAIEKATFPGTKALLSKLVTMLGSD